MLLNLVVSVAGVTCFHWDRRSPTFCFRLECTSHFSGPDVGPENINKWGTPKYWFPLGTLFHWNYSGSMLALGYYEWSNMFLSRCQCRSTFAYRKVRWAKISRRGENRASFLNILKKCRFRYSETTDSFPQIGLNFPGNLWNVFLMMPYDVL